MKAKRLRRDFQIYCVKGTGAKLHLSRECTALGRSLQVTSATYESAGALIGDQRQPCRLCLLEPLLLTVLRPNDRTGEGTWPGGLKKLVTFSAQPVSSGRWGLSVGAASESGQARLARVAGRRGLTVVTTSVGLVAYGVVPYAGYHTLSRNLRTKILETDPDKVTPAVVETYWSFVDDAESSAIDPLEAALCVNASLR